MHDERAPVGTLRRNLARLMRAQGVRHLPLIDHAGHPVNLIRLDDLASDPGATPRAAMIMVGGEGLRLRPLTAHTPKPMLPVDGRPLLERIVEQLRDGGIDHITLAVRYLGHVIEDHFGDGSAFGVTIDYTREQRPMGTGGALSLIDPPDGLVLVMNGDILTDVSVGGLLHFHAEQEAAITIGVRRLDIQPPYGIVDIEGIAVVGIRERPTLHYFANAGLYLLDPCVWDFVAPDTSFDMPDLVQRAVEAERRVVSFPIGEEWIDIGEHNSYQQVGSVEDR